MKTCKFKKRISLTANGNDLSIPFHFLNCALNLQVGFGPQTGAESISDITDREDPATLLSKKIGDEGFQLIRQDVGHELPMITTATLPNAAAWIARWKQSCCFLQWPAYA